jgi:hypothetical protein
MSEYQWLLNNGLAVVVVVFLGVLLWRVLVGSKATGYQGILIRWANGLAQDVHKHATEATGEFAKASVQHKTGIEALKQYRREWDDKRKTFNTRPLHDWTSHGADAFRYLSVAYKPKQKRTELPKVRIQIA